MSSSSGVIDSSAARVPAANEPRAEISGTSTATETASFAELGVSQVIVEALADKGIVSPFPIQALTLPVALRRADIIGQAKTGTGKTLGFGIPMIENTSGPGEEGWEKIPQSERGKPQGLVVLPTRELAKQVAGELSDAAARRSVRIVELYGGRAYEPQQVALREGAEIVVGTPGRIIDLMRHRVLNLSRVRTLVLDEADEMLDLGFLEDVETILSATPGSRHTMLFSATMPAPVVAMARRYMDRPTHIHVQDPEDTSATVKDTRQVVYRCHALNKVEVVARILQAEDRGLTIIFTRTKRAAAKLADDLTERGFAAGALHGDLGQGAREQALRAFRNGKVDVLVATDVAARGIDVDNVTHVINYQCPEDEKTYIHRIGRTGRAGHSGTAVTFVDWEDLPRWAVINRLLNLGQADPVETYHTSDHLYSDLGIPRDAGGKLPTSKRVRAGLDAEYIEDLGGPGAGHGRNAGKRGRSRATRNSGERGGRKSSRARQRRRTKTTDGSAQRQAQPRSAIEDNPQAAPRRERKRRRVHRSQDGE
ncbi:DEAD/DEAH box helicase [Actinobaculum sp. 352]|uniref:DEAD/DEAH box helicase n=1 Tax=Actinobaculum sp. 352 TaxID=2490946 RepID=UPI000F7E06DE|nr:DEAD/DEAH box helicase [Actinobaculum sp. 352]RTE50711.1 DEAD/DEAH box helicase [Actinobaculum sp. 352]